MTEATSAAPGTDNPLPDPEKRTCTKCGETKVVTPESWVYRKGRQNQYQAHGAKCLACEKKRKAEYEARRDQIATKAAVVPDSDPKGKPEDKRKALAKLSKLDVAHALRAGSHVLNEYAPAVLARVLEYLEDPDSEHHIWALELLAQRVLPRKLYEELGGRAAGTDAINNKRPVYTINVSVAAPGSEPQGQVYENLALPAPAADEEPEEQV